MAKNNKYDEGDIWVSIEHLLKAVSNLDSRVRRLEKKMMNNTGKGKLMMFVLVLFVLPAIAQARTVTLNGEIEIDWTNQDNFIVEVGSGEQATFNCNNVNSTNYNNYDTEIEEEAVYEGKRYQYDVEVNWLSATRFRIETYSTDFGPYDCEDVTNNNYNNYDDSLSFTWTEDLGTDSDEELKTDIEEIISKYVNYTTEISTCRAELTKQRAENTANYDKYISCEQAKGKYDNEIIHLQNEKVTWTTERDTLNTAVNDKEVQIATLTAQVDSCNAEKTSLAQQKTTAEQLVSEEKKKASNNFLIGAGIVLVGAFLLNRKPTATPPEVQEFGYSGGE